MSVASHAAAGAGKKLIVVGGNGYVGSHISKLAVEHGWNVIIACRSGKLVRPSSDNWEARCSFVKVDALSREQVFAMLDDHKDTDSIVSCVGKLTLDGRDGRRINGDPTLNLAAAAYHRKQIRKLVFLSAAESWPMNKVLHAYYYGKKQAEKAMVEQLGERYAILRPGFIHGTRVVSGNVSLPLGLIGAPLEFVFRPLHNLTGLSIFTPPVRVTDVAAAAVHILNEPQIFGTFEYEEIRRLAKRI